MKYKLTWFSKLLIYIGMISTVVYFSKPYFESSKLITFFENPDMVLDEINVWSQDNPNQKVAELQNEILNLKKELDQKQEELLKLIAVQN